MAGYRQFHTKFWKDEWVIELEPIERYLYSYLFTNELSSIAGIYKLPLKVIINETSLDREFITVTLAKFQEAQKIFYKDGVMWVVKMREHHRNASPKTMTRVNADVADIPDCDVKRAYLYYEETHEYRIDTVSIPILKRESVSLNENKNKSVRDSAKRATPSPTPDLFQLAQTLASVTGLDFEKNRGRLFKEAKTYQSADAIQIQADYGAGGRWYTCDWRGQKGQKPGLSSIRETWNNLTPPANGHKSGNHLAESLAAIQQVEDEINGNPS